MSGQSRSRRPVEERTDPRRRTLRELRLFTSQQGFLPTTQELADILGTSPPSTLNQVNQPVTRDEAGNCG